VSNINPTENKGELIQAIYTNEALSKSLRGFCVKEHSNENIDFLLALNKQQGISTEKQKEAAETLYDTYIDPKSKIPTINLPADIFDFLEKKRKDGNLKIADLDGAKDNIEKLIKNDTLGRYLESPLYTQYKAEQQKAAAPPPSIFAKVISAVGNFFKGIAEKITKVFAGNKEIKPLSAKDNTTEGFEAVTPPPSNTTTKLNAKANTVLNSYKAMATNLETPSASKAQTSEFDRTKERSSALVSEAPKPLAPTPKLPEEKIAKAVEPEASESKPSNTKLK